MLNSVGLNDTFAPTLPDNLPLWTLSYEIWFYVLAGATALVVTRRSPAALFIVAIAICLFSTMATRYALFWALGAMSSLIMGHRRALFALGLVLFVFGATAYELASASRSFVNARYLPPETAEALICIGTSLLLPLLASGSINRALISLKRLALWLSSISYSLYLIHYPLIIVTSVWLPKYGIISLTSIGVFILRGAIIFGGVYLFYLTFEARTGAARRYLKRIVRPTAPEAEVRSPPAARYISPVQ